MPLHPSVAKRFADAKQAALDEAAAIQRDIDSMRRLQEKYGPINFIHVSPSSGAPPPARYKAIVAEAENVVRITGRPVKAVELLVAITARGFLADVTKPESRLVIMLNHYSNLRALEGGRLGWWWKGFSWPPTEEEMARTPQLTSPETTPGAA